MLARRVSAEGRTRAFVEGRSATAADLQALGGRLVAFFGQHEHRRLTLASAQLDLLDGFCGREQLELRDRAGGRPRARARELERELDELRERAGTRDRDLDLLAFEIEEIEALEPTGAGARGARRRAGAPAPDGRPAGRGGRWGGGDRAVVRRGRRGAAAGRGRAAGRRGAGGRPGARRARRAAGGAADRGRGPGRASCAATPTRSRPSRAGSQEVEERLEQYDRLERKHGGSVAAVLEHAERCRAERERLEQAEVATERAEAELAEALRRARLARRASSGARRAEAAPKLAERVREELAALAMEDASFEVAAGAARGDRAERRRARRADAGAQPGRAGGADPRGGVGRRAVAGDAGADDGGGHGRVADAGVRRGRRRRGRPDRRAVGERLRALGESRQVLCITHLPQIAALASGHFRIEKSAADDTALTTVEELAGDGVVEELMRMLGAEASDGAARKHAKQLLAAA